MSQDKDEQDGEKHEQNPEEMAQTKRSNEETKGHMTGRDGAYLQGEKGVGMSWE